MSPTPKHVKPDINAVLYVQMPGWLKNQIIDQSEAEGQSVSSWVQNVLYLAVQEGQGVPPPPPAQAPLPSVGDVLRGYVTGEQIIEPCGRPAPCERMAAGTTRVGDVDYCKHCGIRLL